VGHTNQNLKMRLILMSKIVNLKISLQLSRNIFFGFGLNSIYDNLSKLDKVKFNSTNEINFCSSVSLFNAYEPVPITSKRFASVFALERIRLLNNMLFIPF